MRNHSAGDVGRSGLGSAFLAPFAECLCALDSSLNIIVYFQYVN